MGGMLWCKQSYRASQVNEAIVALFVRPHSDYVDGRYDKLPQSHFSDCNYVCEPAVNDQNIEISWGFRT